MKLSPESLLPRDRVAQELTERDYPKAGHNGGPPLDDDTLLSRQRVAEELTARGLPTAANTLRTMASRGGGPPYRRFGRVTVYRWGDSWAWAVKRLSEPMRSTSEADGQRAA